MADNKSRPEGDSRPVAGSRSLKPEISERFWELKSSIEDSLSLLRLLADKVPLTPYSEEAAQRLVTHLEGAENSLDDFRRRTENPHVRGAAEEAFADRKE